MLKFYQKYRNTIFWTLFGLAFLFLVLIQYYGVVHFRYPDTPGDDTFNHWSMIQSLQSSGKGLIEAIRTSGYPPLYHFTILKISLTLGVPAMTVMLWTYPAIIVLAALAAYLLAYAVFNNRNIAFLAFLLYGFTAQTPIQLLHDGGYPNLIAAHILLPTALALLMLAWKSSSSVIARSEATKQSFDKLKTGSRLPRPFGLAMTKVMLYTLGALVLIILIPLVHHISTFEMLGVAIASAPLLLLAGWIKNKWQWWKGVLLFALYFLLLFLLGYAYLKSPIFAPFRSLASIMIEITGQFPFIKSLVKPEDAAIVPWRSLPGWIGRLIVPLGLLFIPLFSCFKTLRRREYLYPLIIVSIWSFLLLLLSQSAMFTNPERLARDSAFPLSILAAGAIYYFAKYLWKNKILFAIFVVICLFLAYKPLHTCLSRAFSYEPMVRVTQADLQAIEILQSKKPAPLLFNSWVYFYEKYLPGWPITYVTTLKEEEQEPISAPSTPDSTRLLSNFKYIYIIDSQLGWAPKVRFGIAERYLEDSNFRLLGDFSSPINHVYLFENENYYRQD